MSEPSDGDGSDKPAAKADEPKADAKQPTAKAVEPEPAEAKAEPKKAEPTTTEAKVEPKKAEPTKAEPAEVEPTKEPAKTEPAKAEVKTEPAKAEPAKAEVKTEPAKAVKTEPAKAEVKTEPKKAEPAKAEVKTEPKKELAKTEPNKTEPAKAEVKTEPKKEPGKAEVKTEPKKEPARAEPAKAEVKAEPKKTEVKAEPKKVEPKKADSKDNDAKIRGELDVPETRKQELTKEAGPAERPSQSLLDMTAVPLTYPDDGPISAGVRRLDNIVGRVEQVSLIVLLLTIVLVGASAALLDKIATVHLEFKDEVMHGATFVMAMIGASYATQQARNLSMDLLSRRFSARGRLFLKVILGLFTIFIVAIVIRAGLNTIDIQAPSDAFITPRRVAWSIPIGGALIILHSLLHLIIDVDYIARRKLPPERMRSGH